jgi:predicted nucleic acid-binding protein
VAEALILDAEAINALARPNERGALYERALSILMIAGERRALIRVPAPVLAEVCRGARFDAAIDHLLNGKGILVQDLTRSIAQRAGALLARAKMSSQHAVDAFVAASALEFDAAVVATADSVDMQQLLAPHPQVEIFRI